MKRTLEEKNEKIKYEGKSVIISVYRNLLNKSVSISIWMQEKGTFHAVEKNELEELRSLLNEMKAEDLEIKWKAEDLA